MLNLTEAPKLARQVPHSTSTLRKQALKGFWHGRNEKCRRLALVLNVGGAPVSYRGFTNINVNRSLSPIARYFARSFSPSRSTGGKVQTPPG